PREGRPVFVDPVERWPWVVLFAGAILTGFGSAWYHWSPSNESLVWDRMPMALVAMSVLSAVIAERIGVKAGVKALVPLLLVGVFSVLYWIWTEQRGTGDLRLYGLV